MAPQPGVIVPDPFPDGSALILSAADRIRFVPAAHFSGNPGKLSVLLLDSSAALNSGANLDTTARGAAPTSAARAWTSASPLISFPIGPPFSMAKARFSRPLRIIRRPRARTAALAPWFQASPAESAMLMAVQTWALPSPHWIAALAVGPTNCLVDPGPRSQRHHRILHRSCYRIRPALPLPPASSIGMAVSTTPLPSGPGINPADRPAPRPIAAQTGAPVHFPVPLPRSTSAWLRSMIPPP
jgi:hypothetical protein